MGMSSYILDLEEQFDTKVLEAIKESEHVSEAVAEEQQSISNCGLWQAVPHLFFWTSVP